MITAFTILVGILSAAIAFISTTHKLTDRRFNGVKQIMPAGWWVILLAVVLIAATVIQDYIKDNQNQNRQDKRDAYQKGIYDSSLSQMKARFDTSNQRLVTIVSDVLGNYGFKLDSQNRVLRSLETSLQGNESAMPFVTISQPFFTRYFMNDSTSPMINFKVESINAASSFFDINVDLIYGDGALLSNGSIDYIPFGQNSLMPYSKRLNKNESHTVTYFLIHRRRLPICYFWIRGEYRTVDGNRVFKVDHLYYFNFLDKKSGTADDKIKKEVIKKIGLSNS